MRAGLVGVRASQDLAFVGPFTEVVRVLDVIFWLAAAALVGALIFLDEPAVNAVLMAVRWCVPVY